MNLSPIFLIRKFYFNILNEESDSRIYNISLRRNKASNCGNQQHTETVEKVKRIRFVDMLCKLGVKMILMNDLNFESQWFP